MVSEAETSLADAALFQSFLHKHQYPADCASTVGRRERTDYFYGLGLGAQLVSLKFGFLSALLHKRVYHFPTSHYVSPVGCPSRSFDCYFEPPTNCSLATEPEGPRSRASHASVRDESIRWCFDLPERTLGAMAGLERAYSKSWFHAQLAAFLFRPSAGMRRKREELLATLEHSDPLSNASRTLALKEGELRRFQPKKKQRSRTGRRLSLDAPFNRSCVAMHIRRTDKFKTHRREDHMPMKDFDDYAQLYKVWAYWSQSTPPSELRIFLGSEDKTTFARFPPLVAPTTTYWVPPRHFVMDMSEGKAFKSINQGNSRLGQLYDAIEARAKQRGHSLVQLREMATRGDGEAAQLLKDEGMVLVAQMLMMSECRAMIGSFASNVAIFVHDLMFAKRLEAGLPMQMLDVNGRSYCGCGASFCTKLERKLLADPSKTASEAIAKYGA